MSAAATRCQLASGASRTVRSAGPVNTATSHDWKPIDNNPSPLSFTACGQVRVIVSGCAAETGTTAPSGPLFQVFHPSLSDSSTSFAESSSRATV